jgi:hypothetical protein
VDTQIVGDVTGAVFGTAGEVILTAFTTDDNTASSASPPLTLSGRDFLTFKHITFVGGSGATNGVIDASTATSTSINFYDCRFIGTGAGRLLNIAGAFSVAFAWNVERCVFVGRGVHVNITAPTGTGADWNVDIDFFNCRFIGGASGSIINLSSSGSSANWPGGVRIYNCMLWGGASGVIASVTRLSTSIPCDVQNCILYGQGTTALNATTSGQITSNYNRTCAAATARSNVTAGANDITIVGSPGLDFWAGIVDTFTKVAPWGPQTGGVNVAVGNTSVAPTLDFLSATRPNPPSVGDSEYATLTVAGGGLVAPHVGPTALVRA